MKTYLASIIPKLIQFSKKLDTLTQLSNQRWVSLSDIGEAKKVFIFRQSKQLFISTNGLVEKGSWEYIDENTLLIDYDKTYLFKHAFLDENIFALKLDSTEKYVFFINENKYNGELNSLQDVIDFLDQNYLSKSSKQNQYKGLAKSSKQNQYKGLAPPSLHLSSMLLSDSQTLIKTTIKWRQYCDSHSELYPLYTYQELVSRGVMIQDNLKIALKEYAYSKGYSSFEKMLSFYKKKK